MLKKIYIDCCDNNIKKIEYFRADGSTAATVKLNDFAMPGVGTSIAREIDITYYDEGKMVSQVQIDLKSIKPFEVTQDKLKGELFQRPSTKGFKNIHKLETDCRFVQQ